MTLKEFLKLTDEQIYIWVYRDDKFLFEGKIDDVEEKEYQDYLNLKLKNIKIADYETLDIFLG